MVVERAKTNWRPWLPFASEGVIRRILAKALPKFVGRLVFVGGLVSGVSERDPKKLSRRKRVEREVVALCALQEDCPACRE